MRLEVVHFHLETLADAQIIFEAASHQHLSGLEDNGETTVVGLNHLEQMPLAVLKVFGSGCQHKP